jgi:dephospho-CoA kinase
MKIIGLTGGIGMGKSTAAAAFRRCGVPVFDADAEVHRLQAPGGRALPAIEAAFRGTVKHSRLDRAALRARVLSDRAALKRLENILHPLVRHAQRRFLDIPLLFETRGDRAVDYVVVVSAPATVQRSRVRARRHMADSEISAMIAAQMPDAAKRRRADTIIRTGLSRHHAVRQIRRLLKQKGSSSFLKKRSKKLLQIKVAPNV